MLDSTNNNNVQKRDTLVYRLLKKLVKTGLSTPNTITLFLPLLIEYSFRRESCERWIVFNCGSPTHHSSLQHSPCTVIRPKKFMQDTPTAVICSREGSSAYKSTSSSLTCENKFVLISGT